MIPTGYSQRDYLWRRWPPHHALIWDNEGRWVLKCQPKVRASWVHNVETIAEITCDECRALEAVRKSLDK